MNVMRTAAAGLTHAYQTGFGNRFEMEALPGALFMFESRHRQRVTQFAAMAPQLQAQLQRDYADCWAGLRKRFDPANPNAGAPEHGR